MTVYTLLLFMAILFTTEAGGSSGQYRMPSCGGMSETQACPLNYSPVCGTNGITYANECALCVQRLETKADILIVKDGPC
ncbi:hypothetical protein COCON_G00119350 [Conger conger]|uniref:Kazal-like domain-containing protein n=1 Tax=Conger conger TaxID=82655 RepID=A0A9Q1DGN7_CONCO|nr:probable pancreatic secretory proteinase inhibitor [Conger conger]KAJ8269328.1 hypothetical protein COCON_G00119350 [Conger conger]